MVGTPALHAAQKVGVIDDAGEVGVLVRDADGEEVPAIVNLTIKGNALRTIHRKIHGGGVVLSSDFPATPSRASSWSSVVTIDPKNATAFHNRAAGYSAKGSYDRAIADMGASAQWLRLSSLYPKPWIAQRRVR